MSVPVISLQQVSAAYGREPALTALTLSITAGALVAVIGPNGGGKSTFMKLITGLLRPRTGTVTVAQPFAYLPQASSLQRDLPLNVLQAVCTAFWSQLGNHGAIDHGRIAAARAALHEVGLLGCETRQLSALSGGQFQRLLFARVILQDAPIILLDEPFAAVDAQTTKTLLQLILAWQREGRTVLCVLHDLAVVRRYFPQVLLLDRRCIAYAATTDLVTQGMLGDTALGDIL